MASRISVVAHLDFEVEVAGRVVVRGTVRGHGHVRGGEVTIDGAAVSGPPDGLAILEAPGQVDQVDGCPVDLRAFQRVEMLIEPVGPDDQDQVTFVFGRLEKPAPGRLREHAHCCLLVVCRAALPGPLVAPVE